MSFALNQPSPFPPGYGLGEEEPDDYDQETADRDYWERKMEEREEDESE